MRTLADAFSSRPRDADNNFLILRLLAACLVVYGHSFALADKCSSCFDVVSTYLRYRYSGDLGLHIFFVISGFLITASFCNRKSIGDFAKARIFRIYPGLIVCVIFMLLVGVVATTLSMKEFWTSSRTYSFIMKNITLRGVQFDLPGVFQSLKYGGAMNGSLWSLPVEIRLYIILACCGLLGLFRKGAVFNVWAIGIFATALLEPHWIFFFKTSPANLRVAAFFLLGSLLYINRARVPLHWPFLALFAAVSAMCFGTPAYQWLADLTVAYAVFVIAFAPKIKLPNYIEDFSFGIYLYAWPFQQLIAHAKPEWGPYEMAACALPAAWLAGVLSWYAVEKPALRLRRIKFIALGRSLFVGSSGRVQQKSPS